MKNFSLKSVVGISAIVFAVAALIALPLRTCQFFNGTLEPSTGFYARGSVSGYVLGVILAAAVLFFIVIGIINRKKLAFDRTASAKPVFGIFSFIGAAGFFANGITNAMPVIANNFEFKKEEFSVTAGGMVEVWDTEMLFFAATAVLAILSAIFMLAIGISAITGKSNGSEHKLISLSPVLFCIICLVTRFNRTISYMRVSELIFELLAYAFAILFFMAFAQLNARISDKNIEWKLIAYGLPTALFAALCFIPRLIVIISGNQSLLYEFSTSVDISMITIALFAVAAVFTRIHSGDIEKIGDTVAAAGGVENAEENAEEKEEASDDTAQAAQENQPSDSEEVTAEE